ERSRWNGVGSTLAIGRDARTSGSPAYGSRYDARTEPLAFSTRSVRALTCSSVRSSADSRASGPRGSAGPRFRRVVLRVVVFFVAVFFAGLMTPLLLVRPPEPAGAVPLR